MFAGLAGQNPDEARWSLYRGQSLAGLERYAEAAAAYVRALELAPDDPQVLTAYSWLLSACPDPALHDGDKSLSLAERACEVTERSDPRALDCWAAALARCGRFDEAVAAADRAQGLAHDHGWTALAEQIKQRKLDYQAARPLDRLPEVRSD
jgi:tetratricopeptide (TPR) repeat protein